jgi:uncharacterized protein involved in exopolysaccharide biosynthesis
MNIAEGQRLKALETEVASLKAQVADLTRRLDDFSKADRARETLKLKKGEAA